MLERISPGLRPLVKFVGRTLRGLAVVAVAVVAFMLLIAYLDYQSKQVSPKEAQCRQNLECWGKSNISNTRACVSPIEHILEYDYKWTDGVLQPKMSKYRWHNAAALTLTYSGDSLMVQNANGAFVRTTYECDFDPINDAVLSVRVSPGRLNR